MFLVQAHTEFGVKSRGAATAADALKILDQLGDDALGIVVQDEGGRTYEREDLKRIAEAATSSDAM